MLTTKFDFRDYKDNAESALNQILSTGKCVIRQEGILCLCKRRESLNAPKYLGQAMMGVGALGSVIFRLNRVHINRKNVE